MRTELKEEIRASEAKQAKRTDELKADNKALGKNGPAVGGTHCHEKLELPSQ